MAPNSAIQPLPDHGSGVAPVPRAPALSSALPIWGGVECTFNRVGDRYFDQVTLSGHRQRQQDFECIAALGIRTLRLGTLWERYAEDRSWQWMDACIAALDRSGIAPIAGLLHHGSGPPHTSLLHEEFPAQLASFAASVAERYPHIEAYTPVNEPNTTARFSGLYGLWYPHGRSPHAFLRALLNQVKGTVLSMQAIRRIRSDARLIQTDDAGSISSTPELRATADLVHARQWLTFDLLCGRVDRSHPMFDYICSHSVPEQDVLWFQDHPCPPDVIGLNYYPTSDRFLDHRVHLYPPGLGSSEGPYIDVEAVRVCGTDRVNFGRPIREAWQRYGLPVALTEVHLGGHPAEQVRWLSAAYHAMQRARHDGVECAGLTVWALLGSYFWNELVTRDNGHYEPGVFDVSTGAPYPTPLAEVVRQIVRNEAPQHPALGEPGWWLRPERTCYPWAEPSETRAA